MYILVIVATRIFDCSWFWFRNLKLSFKYYQFMNEHCRKNHIFFFRTSWKDGLSKNVPVEYDLSCIIRKDDISFPENMILHIGRKMKDDFSYKKHGNMIFSLDLLKIWSFQRVPHRHMIFLVLSGKVVSFSRKHDLFTLGRKRKTAVPRKYMEKWCITQRKKDRKPDT